MPEDLIKKLDKQSRASSSNRSDFIRQAVRKQLDTLEQWNTVSKAVRSDYAGKDLSEQQVANIVRETRAKSQ